LKIKYLISLLLLLSVSTFLAIIPSGFSSPAFAQGELKSTGEVSVSDANLVTVSSADFNVSFSREGASLKKFNLNRKKFQDDFIYKTGDLETGASEIIRPFTVDVSVAAKGGIVTLSDNKVVYDVKQDKIDANVSKVIFTGVVGDGTFSVGITKIFTVDSSSRLIKLSLKIKNNSPSPISIGTPNSPGLALNFLSNIGDNAVDDECVADIAGSLYKSITNSATYKYEFNASNFSSDVKWIGIRDSFYSGIIAFDNKKPHSASVAATGHSLKNKMGFTSNMFVRFPAFDLDAAEAQSFDFSIFLGVKSYDDLKKYGRGFEEICEFNFLALLILQSLVFFYGMTKNYGVAIILLTIAIKLILQPLTNKQTKSMKEMQKIQPLIAELKKKYATDMQKMNEEVMKLYKEHGINPFGGCLPLLLQLPVLFALFTALRSSVELKGEGFLWLADLSAADPTWILPIAIAISMHLQQSQMQVDPNQAAAFQFMPILMFMITYTLPSGVLLYWGVSNVLQVAQQWYDNRRESAGKAVVAIAAADNDKGGNS